MENRAFNEMLKAARGWLEGRDPADIARGSGAVYDDQNSRFCLRSLGREIQISYPEYTFSDGVAYWHQLVILHYLLRADGCPRMNKPVSFSGIRDGMIRGGGFDRDSAEALARIINGKSEEELRALFQSVGGKIIDSNADLCAEIDFLPNYPVTIKIYLADDEFPAEGRMLLDASADHYLPVEDAVTAGSILLEALEGKA